MKLLLLITVASLAQASSFFAPLTFGDHNPPDVHFSDSFHFTDYEAPKWEEPTYGKETYGSYGYIDCYPEQVPHSDTPEPATFGVMGLGLIGIALLRKGLRNG